MDFVRSKKNIIVSIGFKLVLLALGILTTRYLIRYTGNDVNGINSLFKSIVGFLTIAELGMGTAISYCMYKPIVDGDGAVVSALYRLLRRIYQIIGGIIFVAGLCVLPFLPFLVKGYTADVNIYFTYVLMLISVVISYFYSSKSSLINAYKNNYITTTITSVGMILQQVLQIVVLVQFQSFELFLACRIFAALFQWVVTEIVSRKSYSNIIKCKGSPISAGLKKEIFGNIKAMFMHKIGGILVNTVDSIIISAFCGVVLLGKYSNYVTIMTSMTAVLVLVFTPLTSIIGHLFVESGGDVLKKYYGFFNGVNYILGTVFFLGYYAVIDNVVLLFFGKDLGLSAAIKMVITVNYFIQFFRQSTLLFRDATGTFYHDRWKPLIEGVANLLLSLLFVMWFPPQLKVVGVLVATIITNLFICHVVEPYVLYKHVFCSSVKKHYIRNYLLMAFFVMLIFVYEWIKIQAANIWMDILINGCLAVLLAVTSLPLLLIFNKDFRFYIFNLLKKRRIIHN